MNALSRRLSDTAPKLPDSACDYQYPTTSNHIQPEPTRAASLVSHPTFLQLQNQYGTAERVFLCPGGAWSGLYGFNLQLGLAVGWFSVEDNNPARYLRMSVLHHRIILVSTSLSLLALALAIPFTPSAALDIVRRGSGSCPLENFTTCADPKAPPNFCCPPATKCITLNYGDSMVCCPAGANCLQWTLGSCDPGKYDPEHEPMSIYKSKRPDIALQRCGDKCCPPGTGCKESKNGVLYCQVSFPDAAFPPFPDDKGRSSSTPQLPTSLLPSQTGVQTETGPTSPPTSTGRQGPDIIPISTLGQQPTTTSTATHNIKHTDPPPEESKFPPIAIIVGLIPGLVAGIILALAVFYLYKRHQERRFVPSPMSKFSHFREKSCEKGVVSISDPIPSAAQDSVRTDFLRRQASLVKEDDNSTKSKFRRTSARVKSFFGPRPTADDIATMPMSTTMSNRDAGPNGVGGRRSGGGAGREPSTESIKVFSPAHLRPAQLGELYQSVGNGRPQTTFSEMMERVGFQSKNGSPYFSVTTTPPLPQVQTPRAVRSAPYCDIETKNEQSGRSKGQGSATS
ncbi:hypothetical protein BDBG_07375 [Blastomyces gilchristii SLH14081]|uniref:Uncharacterized protein n=1 Tax=Blastomyces gilchristii (strain SLH14081) TaxID=559298 RepID=A0A179UV92_BLAGS|nr:uncharacterized protein BDBG_07375 [Blastomyces gilchristii SLH14081]EQL35016.1 hypothetical protein BDFG_03236 [Blastomyces dermatitidis ATCC 26199]OAT11964.1 hypothetical protein BDBG_07375 [Blastomyces gilchristii SLH14081]